MTTIHNTNVETINRNTITVCGHEVRASWSVDGPVASRSDLRAIRDAGHANWSDDEIEKVAIHCEERLSETYEREYRIAYAATNGEWDVVDTFRAADDAAANAYAEENSVGEWYVLDDQGRNINGGRDQA